MGIDDRDYMRERYRARSGATKWNDRAWRVEGTWFDPINRAHDYQRGRFKGGGPPVRVRLRWLPLALSFLLAAIPAYHSLERAGWLADPRPAQPFPETGSVTVNSGIDPRSATARLAVVTANANAVVQLFDWRSDRHVISVISGRTTRQRSPSRQAPTG